MKGFILIIITLIALTKVIVLVLPAASTPVLAITVKTGLGDVDATPQGVVQKVFQLALGTGGGIALLLILYGLFKYATSGGDPYNTKDAQEVITAALAGLAVILFSVVILKVIGYDILRLPGFGPKSSTPKTLETLETPK